MQHGKQQRSSDAGGEWSRVAKPQSEQQPTEKPLLNQGHAHGRNQHLRQHAANRHRFFAGRKIPHRLEQRGKSPQHANRDEASGQGLDQRCFPRQLLPQALAAIGSKKTQPTQKKRQQHQCRKHQGTIEVPPESRAAARTADGFDPAREISCQGRITQCLAHLIKPRRDHGPQHKRAEDP